MAVRVRTIEHDFATDPDRRIDLPNAARVNIFSVQILWEGLEGTLDAVIKVQGSNFNPARGIFDDLPELKKTLDSPDDSHTLIGDNFPFEHGGVAIKNNGVTKGKATLQIFAK